MIDKNIPCTRDCPNRNTRCHSSCTDYIEWHENRIKQQKAYHEQRNLEMKLDNYEVVRSQRLRKRINK